MSRNNPSSPSPHSPTDSPRYAVSNSPPDDSLTITTPTDTILSNVSPLISSLQHQHHTTAPHLLVVSVVWGVCGLVFLVATRQHSLPSASLYPNTQPDSGNNKKTKPSSSSARTGIDSPKTINHHPCAPFHPFKDAPNVPSSINRKTNSSPSLA